MSALFTGRLLRSKDTLSIYSAVFSYKFQFSTFPTLCQPSKRAGNPNRGESALRRTGLHNPVGMSAEPLPVPVLDPKRRSQIIVDKDHGLWGFFNKERTALSTPEQDAACG